MLLCRHYWSWREEGSWGGEGFNIAVNECKDTGGTVREVAESWFVL